MNKRKVKPGTRLKMGIVCRVNKDGAALIGREARPSEKLPPEHLLYKSGQLRVFLSVHQAWIAAELLE